MKKGHVILILIGLALLAFLYFSPVTPSTTDSDEAVVDQARTSPDNMDPDLRVDEALRELQDGSVPPMQAILKIRAVAEEHPNNQKAQLTLGLLSLQTAQFSNAVIRFGNLIALDSLNGESWRFLAEAKLGSGDTVEARNDFEKALLLVNDEMGNRFKEELPVLVRN